MIGEGLSPGGVIVQKWARFAVDVSLAGMADLKVLCDDSNGNRINVITKKRTEHMYNCRFMPKDCVDHLVTITYGRYPINGSPFRVRKCSTATHKF